MARDQHKYASAWPNITEKRDAPPDAKEFDGVTGKFEKYFSKPRRRRLSFGASALSNAASLA